MFDDSTGRRGPAPALSSSAPCATDAQRRFQRSPAPPPLYSAERQRLESLERKRRESPTFLFDYMKSVIDELREEVRTMREDLAALRHHGLPAPSPTPADDDDAALSADRKALEEKAEQVALLKTELRGLSVCIRQTKAEIAAIRPANSPDDRLLIVSNELDAVVASTEDATQSILDSVEAVETKIHELGSHVAGAYVAGVVNDIQDRITSVFEACNFQDITGQRITKVVTTLKFVEERINAMLAIWGDIDGVEPVPVPGGHRDDDSKLLNGPQLDGAGCSQNDIDAMFG